MSLVQRKGSEFPGLREFVGELRIDFREFGEEYELENERKEIYTQLQDRKIGSEGKFLLRKKLEQIEARLKQIRSRRDNYNKTMLKNGGLRGIFFGM